MTLPIVTNAEVVIVSAAAFLFAVVPAVLSLWSRPEAATAPPLSLGEPALAGEAAADDRMLQVQPSGPGEDAPAASLSLVAAVPALEGRDDGVADAVEPAATAVEAPAPTPLSPMRESEVAVRAEPPVAAAEPVAPVASVPQAVVASDATAAEWLRFRLGDLRRARVDDLPRGVVLDAAAAQQVESIELAAVQRPRAFAVAGVHAAVAEILLFEELWPATSADAFARIEVPLQP